MSTDPNRLERRGAQRFEVHQPLSIHLDGKTVPGFTQDLSARGIFFYAQSPLPEGKVVEFTFVMPSEITFADKTPVRCRGRILRSSDSMNNLNSEASQLSGIAATLDSYEYLPRDEQVTQFVRVSGMSNGETTVRTVSR